MEIVGVYIHKFLIQPIAVFLRFNSIKISWKTE